MKKESWKIVKEAFNKAVELPEMQRRQFLDEKFGNDKELRTEVENMLAADGATNNERFLEDGAFEVLGASTFQNPPNEIADFRIIREIGRGGMGIVFEAVREKFNQRVALKVIKTGMDYDIILSRFSDERKILASLSHPNIARFIDGGKTENGLPFYAMEFIEGTEIDEYCERENLSLEERLRIFLQVCDAVQYAHQNFIAHRDIKPNNILIDKDNTVKLLDFGIAKVLSNENTFDAPGTVTEFRMMTPAYASPEQLSGENVGVQSDVYSLGVILYELLTGRNPFDFSGLRADEAIKLICDTDPPKPSSVISFERTTKETEIDSLTTIVSDEFEAKTSRNKDKPFDSKILKGDLDNIILKALQKSPARRYQTISNFSEDIRRYLSGLPVSARPATLSYRTSKFIKRNRAAVVATSLIFMALFVGLVATLYQTATARKERARAEKRFEEVRKLANNVVFKYHDAVENLPGSTAVREMLVRDAVEYLDNLAKDSEDNPELQNELARAYAKIGDVQGSVYSANLGKSRDALKNYDKSISIYQRLQNKFPNNAEYQRNYILVLEQKALLDIRLFRFHNAEETADKLQVATAHLNTIEPNNLKNKLLRAGSFLTLGDARRFNFGNLDAIKNYRQSQTQAEEILKQNPRNEESLRLLLIAIQRIGTTEEYEAEILKETNAPKTEIAKLYLDAETVHARAMKIGKELKERFPEKQGYKRYISALRINYGTALARNGKGAVGIQMILESCAEFETEAKNDPSNSEAKRDIAECLQYLAFAHDAANNSSDAIAANQKSIELLKDITFKDPSNFEFLAQAHLTFNNTGNIFMEAGDVSEALRTYKRGMDYVDKMSKVNENTQIRLLRSDSNRKIGEAYAAIAKVSGNSADSTAAKQYLTISLVEVQNLERENTLGEINRYKINLIKQRLENLKTPETSL